MAALSTSPGLRLAFAFALREMRGGLRGFYILIACIALGVGAIAGVNAVAASITGGIAAEGRSILGGDVSVSQIQQPLPDELVRFAQAHGDISQSVSLRAMARRADGADQTLIELKAVDDAYPLHGALEGDAGPIVMAQAGADGIWADPLLMERLSVKTGDMLAIGDAQFKLLGAITAEPDRLSDGTVFGPRVMMTQEGLARAGLVRPGSLVTNRMAVRLTDPSAAGLSRFMDEIKTKFPDNGWRIQSRDNAAPSLARNIERFSQFLTLVGLTALIVGGVGVGNSARAFLETKRNVIATLKSVGAPSRFIFRVYVIQIMMLAGLGIAAGLVLGIAMPMIAKEALRGLLPVAAGTTLYWPALALGTAYGLLTAFVFAVWPLALAQETPAATLFRSSGFETRRWPRPFYWLLTAGGLAALVALALLFSEERRIALIFLGAMAFSFVALRVVAKGIEWLARRAPKPRSTEIRMALGNIHRPGSLTSSVVLSLGLGLALIVALTLIDGSLRNQVTANLPKQAPSFFFLDVQNSEIDGFRKLLGQVAGEGTLNAVPMLRGRITQLKGLPASQFMSSEGSWVLRGDRGITYAADKPEGSTVVEGKWWPADYSGEPLVSFAQEEAHELGLKVGDMLEVNVLGRPIKARIANLRAVEWETLSINFVMVFSPNTFAGAPHGWLATLSLPGGASDDVARDGRILREVTKAYPAVTSVRVRDAIEAVNKLIGQLATAIRAASAVALLASLLVLAGALAAGNGKRTHDSVVLKTLGARRGVIMRSFVWEYALLGFATALFALAAGGLAAWFVVTRIMKFTAVFDPLVAAAVVAAALLVTVGLGLAGTWRVLGQKAAPVLREL
jgi:putative ABC transport system permease protein